MIHFGITLSHWQGEPDFDKLSASGIEFINTKASEGNNFIDPSYIRNVQEARRVGMGVIAFHYYRPKDPLGNYTKFLEAVADYPPDLYEIDWEETGWKPSTIVSEVNDILIRLQFITKQIPILYTNPDFGNIHHNVGIDYLLGFMLHVAHYNVGFPLPVYPFIGFDIWQRIKSYSFYGLKGSAPLEVIYTDFNNLIDKAKGKEYFNG